jgi:hypothetical protein
MKIALIDRENTPQDSVNRPKGDLMNHEYELAALKQAESEGYRNALWELYSEMLTDNDVPYQVVAKVKQKLDKAKSDVELASKKKDDSWKRSTVK